MPRLSKAVPSYRKHRPTGQAVVTLNGRDYYLGPHGAKTSKLEYDRLIAEWLQHGRQLEPGRQRDCLSVVELIVAYLHYAGSYYRKDGKPTGELDAITISLRPVKALYGRRPASKFGPTALKVVRQQMVDAGLSRKLINQRIGRVKRMFKWGAAAELVSADIHQALAMLSTATIMLTARTDAPAVDGMQLLVELQAMAAKWLLEHTEQPGD